MIVERSRLDHLLKNEKKKSAIDSDTLVSKIQAHPYIEEIPRLEKQKIEPYLEDQDEIRALNILINQAKCAAIRDRQLLEKKIMQYEYEVYDENMDLEVEEARIENIKIQDAKVALELKRKTENAENIRSQIADNKKKGLKLLADRELDAKNQIKSFQKLAAEDQKKKDVNSIKRKEFIDIISKSNKDAIEKRKNDKIQELEADKKMLKYTMDKIAKEVEIENNKKALIFEKEKAFAALSKNHKKSFDVNKDKDEILALKAAYDFEMKCRAEENKKNAALKSTRENLILERIRLKAIKENALKAEFEKSQQEYQNILLKQVEVDNKMKATQELKKKQLDQFLLDIKEQIDDKRKLKLENNSKFQAELSHFNDEIVSKQAVIDKLKRKKVDDLQKLGVPEKYLYDVKKYIKQTS